MKQIFVVSIALIMIALSCVAQDNSKPVISAEKDQVVVPYQEDPVLIKFFSGECEMIRIAYYEWDQLVADFPSVIENTARIDFNWQRMGTFGKRQCWDLLVNNMGSKTYIGGTSIGYPVDITKAYRSEQVKVVDIKTSYFNSVWTPETNVLVVEAYLEFKEE